MFPVGGPPNEAQPPQGAPGAVCQICHSARSEPITKASRRPSSFALTRGVVMKTGPGGLPREAQAPQGPLGVTCQMCQSALSEPVAKISRRPSSFTCTPIECPISTFGGPPREAQLSQGPLGATCQMCQSALSRPVAKISRRPSSLTAIVGLPSNVNPGEGLPREAQLSQVPLGATCQMCQSSKPSTPPVRAKASRRPSSFFPIVGFALMVPGAPSEVQ